jgi:dimethylsulfide dehydrogenase subunit alpha
MFTIDRRQFLKQLSFTTAGVVVAGDGWALNKLTPIADVLHGHYPYRGWEDLYRKEWTWDQVGYSAHCVNCLGNCAFQVFVKDGIVLREEQLAQYPAVRDGTPDVNPRGCQKGAIHSAAMYEGDRLRYPMKRTGARGAGQWQRISWDQAATEIADKVIDIYEKHGPGKLMTHTGSGNLSHARFAAPYRLASFLGSVQLDILTDVGDLNSGAHLAYGHALLSYTSDAWFDMDYIMLSLINPNVTRIPDAHFLWEARHNGARIVSVAPDYNPSSIHVDLWLPVKPGTDSFLMMSMVNVVLDERLYDEAFMREQTDLTLLVRKDNEKLLRQSDVEAGGAEDLFYWWDKRSNRAVVVPGSMGSAEKTLNPGDVDPALVGEFEVNGIAVQPAFVRMRAEAMKFTPEATQAETGIHPDLVRQEARALAHANKAIIMTGLTVGRYLNGIYTGWAQSLLLALTGHGGDTGGFDTSFMFWTQPAFFQLALANFEKMPRLEPGGLGEFMRGEMYTEASAHFDDEKLKDRVGFNVPELMEMIDESINEQGMPYYGRMAGLISIADNKFRRNKGTTRYRERILEDASELFVDVNIRMDSTAMWADYLLPAASHYEAWDLRATGYHRFMNVFTAPVEPLGDAKPDWDIMALLAEKIQARARDRGIGSYQDGEVSRDLHTLYDDYTMGGKLKTQEDAVRWLVDNSPEIDGTLEEGAKRGFFVLNEKAAPEHTTMKANEPVMPFLHQVIDKKPYPTLSGRITFYCDHDRYLKLKSNVPTGRHRAGAASSKYPYNFFTPHTRWGIHSNWRSNKFMMRLQRGEPHIYVNPRIAADKGIDDGQKVRVFNGIGEFFAQAKIYPSAPQDTLMMEHGWEVYQFDQQKHLNDVTATLLQPLELVGNWGHLKYGWFRWNPNQLAHESSVDIEPVAEA